jgi:hypothetical protein
MWRYVMNATTFATKLDILTERYRVQVEALVDEARADEGLSSNEERLPYWQDYDVWEAITHSIMVGAWVGDRIRGLSMWRDGSVQTALSSTLDNL